MPGSSNEPGMCLLTFIPDLSAESIGIPLCQNRRSRHSRIAWA